MARPEDGRAAAALHVGPCTPAATDPRRCRAPHRNHPRDRCPDRGGDGGLRDATPGNGALRHRFRCTTASTDVCSERVDGAPMPAVVRTEVVGSTLVMTLDRPHARNAVDLATAEQL